MRKLFITIFAVILLLALGGGAWLYNESNKIHTLTVAAGERGGDSFTLLSEISELLARHQPKLSLKVVPSKNSSEGISLINSGTVDMAAVESNTPAYTSIELVAELFSDYFLLITRVQEEQDSESRPFNKVTDIEGHSVALPEAGSVDSFAFWSVIDHYKVAPESFRTFAVPRHKATELFMSGKADSIFFLLSLRDPFLLRFIENAGLRNIKLKFVPIAQADAMKLKRPYLSPVKIVKGAFDGAQSLPMEDVVVPSVERLLVAGSHIDPDLINRFLETIFSNRLDLLIRMPLSSGISDPRHEGAAGLRLHDGASRFYDRDQPSFLQENAEPMALVITIFAMGFSALLALRRSLANRAKNKADNYNEQLLAIASRARESQDMADLRTMRRELGEVLETVVIALDIDQVTEEGFQSFSLLWSSVRETVNDRVAELRYLDKETA